MRLNEILQRNGFYMGRMIGPSKSAYRHDNPNSVCYFNGGLITDKSREIWFGDLDLTKDGFLLKEIAEEMNQTIHVFKESDCFFEGPVSDSQLSKSVWNTTLDIPVK